MSNKLTLLASVAILSCASSLMASRYAAGLDETIDQGGSVQKTSPAHGMPIFNADDTTTCNKDGVVLKVKELNPSYFEGFPIVIGTRVLPEPEETQAPVKILLKFETVFNICFNEEVVGTIKTIFEPGDTRKIYIATINIDEQFQRQGIGTSAIDGLLKLYMATFKKDLMFWARIGIDKTASLKIFSKNGFIVDDVALKMYHVYREIKAE